MYYLALLISLLKLTVETLSEECITPDQHEGDCVSLYFCPVLAATIATQKPEAIEFIRRSNCGGTVVDPKVCCRRLPSNAPPEKCLTPDGNEGECIPLYSCPTLVDKIATQESEAIDFVRRSNCGGTAVNPKVCCRLPPKYKINSNSTTNNTNNLLAENRVTSPGKKLLSDRRYCGFQHADDYFRPNNDTSLDEYPWLAFLIYVDKEGIRKEIWVCSGALISNRYVLTQDICTSERDDITLVGVRLGDHNVDSKTDCVEDSPLAECNLPYEEHGIESIIDYSGPNKIDGKNLVLIRLNKTIEYSDYIRPICLPEPLTTAKVGDTLVTSGWSRSVFRVLLVNTPLKVLDSKKSKTLTRITSIEKCSQDSPRLKFTENHLCTTDVEGSDNWNWLGNFGGPLMFSVKSQWQVEGIVDRGDAFTQRHIKVANYVEWIRQNVKP